MKFKLTYILLLLISFSCVLNIKTIEANSNKKISTASINSWEKEIDLDEEVELTSDTKILKFTNTDSSKFLFILKTNVDSREFEILNSNNESLLYQQQTPDENGYALFYFSLEVNKDAYIAFKNEEAGKKVLLFVDEIQMKITIDNQVMDRLNFKLEKGKSYKFGILKYDEDTAEFINDDRAVIKVHVSNNFSIATGNILIIEENALSGFVCVLLVNSRLVGIEFL